MAFSCHFPSFFVVVISKLLAGALKKRQTIRGQLKLHLLYRSGFEYIAQYRRLLKSPLADAPQVNRYTLLITELGTEIVALTLHHCFYCAMMVAYSAIEGYEICLPHTYILFPFALFFYPLFLLLIRIHNRKCRMGEVFCRQTRQIFAGILDVFQKNLTHYVGKRPARTVV